ncbi:MAG: RelA/spoT family protein, partial [Erysipelotrichaceae bacterium]
MRLALFDLIDETADEFEKNQATYKSAQQSLITVYDCYLRQFEDIYITLNSRIKSETSLREKIIRNKFYKHCNTPEDVFLNLHDLIGLAIECRFISDESKMLDLVKQIFEGKEEEYSVCKLDKRIYLNLKTPQPQLQRNGFTIYRLDGYFLEKGVRINYELQIKSLIHNFWSDVEHQVVYKNNKLVQFDQFMQHLLGSIRDNLDVVDHQLQIVYNQVKKESEQTDDVGMTEDGFKMFLAKSINDLYNIKMIDSVGFTSNFKKCSGIL